MAGRAAGAGHIPDAFARRVIAFAGEPGATWLRDLPALLDECARRWALTLLPPFAPLTFNYVAPALRKGGGAVVLKAGVPRGELLTEMAALRHWDGRGAVRLLEADPARGVALLERVLPGTPLSQVVSADDAATTEHAATVMRALWRPPPAAGAGFPPVADWASGLSRLRARFGGGTGPLPAALVERAERLFGELLPTQASPVLLHGDLHHDNILAASRAPWLAIDPKGITGEPAYETGALLRNPLPALLTSHAPARVLARRVDILCERLALDRQRVLGWGMAQAMLSAWWCIEDGVSGWEPVVACATLLTALR